MRANTRRKQLRTNEGNQKNVLTGRIDAAGFEHTASAIYFDATDGLPIAYSGKCFSERSRDPNNDSYEIFQIIQSNDAVLNDEGFGCIEFRGIRVLLYFDKAKNGVLAVYQ